MLSKSIKVLLLLSLISTPIFAQQMWGEPQRTTFGIRAGLDFHNVVGTDAAGNDLDYSLKPAFQIGVVADVPIASEFSIQPGLLWHSKGFKFDNNFVGESKTKLHYLELPVMLLYKPILANGRLVLGFGPYLAYGIGGKVTYEDADDMDIEFKNEVSVTEFGEAAFFRPWDAGANFTVGYQFMGNMTAQLNAQFGLTEINPDIEENTGGETSLKNIGFGLSIGYNF